MKTNVERWLTFGDGMAINDWLKLVQNILKRRTNLFLTKNTFLTKPAVFVLDTRTHTHPKHSFRKASASGPAWYSSPFMTEGTLSSSSTSTANSLSRLPSMLLSLMLADPDNNRRERTAWRTLEVLHFCPPVDGAHLQHRNSTASIPSYSHLMSHGLTYDVATVVSDESFAVDVDEFRNGGTGEPSVCAQAAQRNILCPFILHWWRDAKSLKQWQTICAIA